MKRKTLNDLVLVYLRSPIFVHLILCWQERSLILPGSIFYRKPFLTFVDGSYRSHFRRLCVEKKSYLKV